MATLAVEKPNLKLSKANAVHWLMLAVLWSPLSPCIAQTYPWYPFPIGKIVVQADGKVLISGGFDRIDGVPRTNLARLNLDGTLDCSFVPAAEVSSNFTQGINWLATQSDGKILVAGWSSNGIIRLETDGGIDGTFQPPTLNYAGFVGVQGGIVQSNGSIVIFGQFEGVGGEVRDGIARLAENGDLDQSFNPRLTLRDGTGKPEVLTIQQDDKIILGGQFDTVDGTPRTRGLARLNLDGSLDSTFNPMGQMSFVPILLAATPTGKIYVNDFLGVARLNADGSPDNEFNPGFGISKTNDSGWPNVFALQADGRLLLGGDFNFYDGTPRAGLVRIMPDGSLDSTFDAQLSLSPLVRTSDQSAVVGEIGVQSNDALMIAGDFTGVSGNSRSWLARLDGNGVLDPTFHALRPIIQQAGINSDGLFTVRIVGETGRPYRVEQTTDLINWSPLRNFLILNEFFEFVDVRQPLLSRVFYRVAYN